MTDHRCKGCGSKVLTALIKRNWYCRECYRKYEELQRRLRRREMERREQDDSQTEIEKTVLELLEASEINMIDLYCPEKLPMSWGSTPLCPNKSSLIAHLSLWNILWRRRELAKMLELRAKLEQSPEKTCLESLIAEYVALIAPEQNSLCLGGYSSDAPTLGFWTSYNRKD